MEIEVNYYYDMVDIYGEKVTIYVFNDNSVTLEYFNFDLCRMDTKEFENETSAYNCAYKRKYK